MNHLNIESRFKNWFSQSIELDVERLAIYEKLRFQLYEDNLLASENASDEPILYSRDVRGLMDERRAFIDYQLLGYWGHTTNANAVIYAWLHNNIRVYLSLPWGNAHRDNQVAKECVPQVISYTDLLVQQAIKEQASISFYALLGAGSFKYYGDVFTEFEFSSLYDEKGKFFDNLCILTER